MTGQELSNHVRNGKYVFGTAVLSTSPLWPRFVASLDLDFVFIDTEHTPIDRETVSWMCQVYNVYGLAPLVRIVSPDPYQASMVLDGGASGVIAPYVETPEQVRQLVGAVKNKPVKGNKLQKKLEDKEAFEPVLANYIEQNNQNNVLIINIESIAGMKALDEMLAINELDGVLVGPHDLTCSLGIPEQYSHPEFKGAVEKIIEKAKAKNKGVGVHMWDAVGFDQEILWGEMGANLIMHSSDIILFKNALENDISKLKTALGETSREKKSNDFNI